MATSLKITQPVPAKQSLLGDKASINKPLEKRIRPVDLIVRIVMTFCGVVSIFTTLGIVLILGQETIGFLSSREFIFVKAPIVDESISVSLTEAINDSTTRIVVGQDIQQLFADDQYIYVDGEVMQIISRSRNVIEVERGADNTEATAHSAETVIFNMQEQQVTPAEPIEVEDTRIILNAGFGREFEVDETIRVDLEIMLITGVNPNYLEVERGYEDTAIVAHTIEPRVEVAAKTSVVDFLTGMKWIPPNEFGIWPLFTATLLITGIALVVAVPMGLGAAIYLSEYAPRNIRNILKPMLEILAGIPTVVYGFFALLFMSPVLREIFGNNVQFQNVLSAGLVVGVLLIPYISSFSEDALQAVPRQLREASYGLGATKLETTIKVVIPAGLSGIMAAFILAASRAIGETMIVALAAGSIPKMPTNLFAGAETMTGHIARISGGDIRYGSVEYTSIFAIGAFLFFVTLLLNILSNYVLKRLREEY